MSKIQHKLDSLLGLVKKGQELYDEYGETIISLANSIKKRNLASDAEFSVADIPEETAIEEFDEEVVTSMQKPTDIKGYREEIESDDSFHETLSTLEDAASIAFDGRITNPQEVCKALETLASVAVDTIK